MREATAADRYAQLDALYAELPRLECRGKCQESCGPIDMSLAERQRIRERGVEIPPLSSPCPALTFMGTCGVFEVRPVICRLWGVVEAMACPWGCAPEGGWLDDATALELIARSQQIGGRSQTVPNVPVHTIRRMMADPEIAAAAGRVMRGGEPRG
jgi:hypothetical protein